MKELKRLLFNDKKKIIMEVVFIITLFITLFIGFTKKNYQTSHASPIAQAEAKEFIYLSDIPYISEQSSVGWGSITMDHNLETRYNNGLIALKVNGTNKLFLKGISAHATSTLVYDISGLNYDYFSTYYGVDASRGTNGNGVKFAIYTSVDGVNWDLHTLVSPPIKKGDSEAEFITIDIRGKNFIKLYAHNNGNATADHATYANAILYKEGYNSAENSKPYDFIKTLEEYDSILKNATYDELLSSKEHTNLARKFVSNIGYDLLQGYAHLDSDHKDTIKWILSDHEALKYYITGGKPTGSYMNSLDVLVKLYSTYKNDLNIKTKTKYNTVLGDLYKRMMITLSLTHSTNVCLWVGGSQCSDAVARYQIYKDMHASTNEFNGGEVLNNELFESLNIEEMRWVMNNNIDDEEIPWLNYFMRTRTTDGSARRGPYSYIRYTFGYNYRLDKYYSAENYEAWNTKYNLSKFNITYTTGKPKLWIVFEEGSVCGGISKTGSNLDGVLGIPSAVLGQPGHAAFMEYSKNSEGKGMWALNNNISGWAYSEKSERLLCGWGSNTWDSYYQVSYVPYAQEALNDLENYNKALEVMLLADVYSGDLKMLEQIYNKALEYQSFNMDAWYGLIRTYQQNEAKTAEDYINLAKRLVDAMYHFPLPMYDLMNLINNNLKGTIYYATYNNYIREALIKGTKLNTNNTFIIQPAISVTLANNLLGNNDYTIASFSFDGENKNRIMLGKKFEGTTVRWDYSLDGGHNWKATSESYVLLSKDEIDSITSDNDILVHIVGVDYSESNIYRIDITENVISEANHYRNDLENRIMGVNLTYEWRHNENDAWTSYVDASPDNSGNKTLQIRQGANGTKLASNVLTFTFTPNNETEARKYINISHLSIHEVSTEAVNNAGSAIYAIDGNYTTRWHSAWNGSDTTRFITIKLDKPVVLAAVEFVPAGGGNGKIIDGTIYGSMDGTNWEELTKKTGLRYPNQCNTTAEAEANTKAFEIPLEKQKQVQYVKIVANRASNGNWFTARNFNLFENVTNTPGPTAGIAYSTTSPTKDNVYARLINKSTENFLITNNGGSDTYIFTKEGEHSFTFEFIDTVTNKKGSATARVNWIDRTIPTATIEFNKTTPTNKEVIATLKASEDVIVTNNSTYTLNEDGKVVDINGNILEGFTISGDYVKDPNGNTIASVNPFTYEFTKNGEFTFEFKDRAGNIGTATAKVSWIDTNPPIASLTYDTPTLTNKDVTVTVNFNEDVIVKNNNASKTYTFKENGEFTFTYRDLAGNAGAITAKVSWIDKTPPTAELKYEKAKDKVIVSVVNPSEEIKYQEGIGVYEFTKNGKYDIVFYDLAGNSSKLTAVIDSFASNPDDPNIPDNPDDPGNIDPIKPPEDPNKPGDDNKPINIEYKKYFAKNIYVEIPISIVNSELVLKSDELKIPEELKNKFGNVSEYYDLYFMNNNERISINSPSPIKVSIRLKGIKEFIDIYEITEDENVQKVSYVKNGNMIEITSNKLGKYVISYNEKKPTSPEETLPIKDRKNRNWMWILASLEVIIFGIAMYIYEKGKND